MHNSKHDVVHFLKSKETDDVVVHTQLSRVIQMLGHLHVHVRSGNFGCWVENLQLHLLFEIVAHAWPHRCVTVHCTYYIVTHAT